MASVTWTATTNGTWSTGADWSVATGPQLGDDVSIPGASGPVSVTYTGGAALSLDSLVMQNGSGFVMTGGNLTVTNGYLFSGPLTLSGGVLDLSNGYFGRGFDGSVSATGGTLAVFEGGFAQGALFALASGATLQITRGQFLDQSASTTLAGLVTGTGELVLGGSNSSVTLNAGFALSTRAVEVGNATVFLNENLSYGNDFTLDQGGVFSTGANTLTLTGLATLDGTLQSSVVDVSGRGHFNGLTLANNSLLSLTGTYAQTGVINLGQTSSGTLAIGSSGELRITGNDQITNSEQGGVLSNAGTLVKTGGSPVGGAAATIAAIVENTGTIDVAVGTLAFAAPTSNGSTSSLGGTITGAGSIVFETGTFAISSSSFALSTARTVLTNSANVTLTAPSLSYAGQFDQTGGTLVVVGPYGTGANTLTLTGTDALDGGLLKGTGTILSSGAVNLGGNEMLEGNVTLDFGTASTTNTVSQTGSITLGQQQASIVTAQIAAGESWLLKGRASSISGQFGTITNNGLFEKLNGSGESVVQSYFDNTATGSLAVESGQLTLSGGGVLAGTVSGPATLDLQGNTYLASGLSLSVGELILDGGSMTLGGALAFNGGFSQEGGTLALDYNNTPNTLTLSSGASLDAGTILGAGEVVVSGAATLNQGAPGINQGLSLQGGARLLLQGATDQFGTVSLSGGGGSPATTLTVGVHGSYTLEAGASIIAPGSGGSGAAGALVTVAGTLTAPGTGTSTISASVVDTGMIKVADGNLSFLGPVSGAGIISIGTGSTVELDGAAGSTAIAFATTAGNGAVLSLADNNGFSGMIGGFSSGDVIELQGFAFANVTPVLSANGMAVTLTEADGQSMTLQFSTSQTASALTVGVGTHGGLALIHL